MQTHIHQNWLGKYGLILLFSTLGVLGIAQKPNPAYRLPVTPDMPEFARQLYRDDIEVNVFELDEEFEEWEEAYEEEHEAEKAEAKSRDEHIENLWEAYYNRWRRAVEPFVQPDGSLDFTIKMKEDLKPKPSPAAESSSSTWSYLGPVTTRKRFNQDPAQPLTPQQANIFCIDVAPSNPDILYYGSESGVIGKTTDKGLTWTQVGADFVTGGASITGGIGAVAIHPTNPNIVYASELGSSQRIVTTTDGGATWSSLLHIPNFNCNDIKIKPNEPEVVFAGGASLQRRTAGNVWTNVLDMLTYDIAFKPNDPSIVYVLVKNTSTNFAEFWKSTDGGLTFSVRPTGWPTGLTNGASRMTVTPADNDRVYAILLTSGGPRLMRSDDAGETWTIQASSPETGLGFPCVGGTFPIANGQGYYDLSIVASHTNAGHIIVGTTTTVKSTDGGVSFTALGGYCGPFDIHPDNQEMVAIGADTWMATDGGISYSTDFFTNTANHSVRITNMRGTEFWGFGSGWNDDVLVGGLFHNGDLGWREGYTDNTFIYLGGSEMATGYINPGNSSLGYFSDLGGRILPATAEEPLLTFSVTKFPSESFFAMESSEQKWDPRYMYTYYLGRDNQFWKTTDNGTTFTVLFTHANPNANVRYFDISRTDPDVIYITVFISGSVDGQLWKTTDGGTNWNQCTNPGTLSASERRFSKVAVSGTDANTLWWCFRQGPNGQKVFKSTDGGSTWTNWTTATLDDVSATDFIHQLGTDGGVYLFNSTGGQVYYRDNVAADWSIYNTGLPIRLGLVFARPFFRDGKLRIATDIGIWEADLYAPSTTTLVQPMTEYAVTNCTRDTIRLESYSVTNGPATYQWTITPAPQWISNPNIRNPRVVLGASGNYSATLTVTDDNGVTNRTINNFIDHLPLGDLCAPDTIPGNALSLDGAGDYAETNGNLNLNTNTTTITAWIKRDGVQTQFSGIVFARGGNTGSGLSINFDNKLRFSWNGTGLGNAPNEVVPDNEWAHVALVVTPTTSLYVNGVGTTFNIANALEEFEVPFRIGSDAINSSRVFKGLIDEVTVWNTALTQDQIRELMHLTVVPSGQPNLVSYYQFNEPSGGLIYDKVDLRHASFVGDATRVVSTGPLGGGTSNRQTITAGGAQTFPGTDVTLGFPASGTYPDGEVVVTRLNVAADSLPAGFDYNAENHYWVINNFGTNQTFTALDSMRLGNFLVPGVHAISPTSYQLTRRNANAHLLPWTVLPGNSIGATGGSNGRISFGNASGITQFGQFLPVNVETCPIDLAVDGMPILDGTYNADQEITSMGTVPGSGDVTFQSETALLQPNFQVALGGVFTVVLLSCFP